MVNFEIIDLIDQKLEEKDEINVEPNNLYNKSIVKISKKTKNM